MVTLIRALPSTQRLVRLAFTWRTGAGARLGYARTASTAFFSALG